MKRIKVAKHVNLTEEAFFLLRYIANNENPNSILEKGEKLYREHSDGKESEKKLNYCKNLADMVRYMTEEMQPKKNKIDYYFKERGQGNEYSMYGVLAVLWNFLEENNQLVPYEEKIEVLTEKERVRFYLKALMDNSDDIEIEQYETFQDLIDYLNQTEYEGAVKWEIINIFQKQEEVYREVYSLLNAVVEKIKKKYSNTIHEMEEDFYKQWTDFQEGKDFFEVLENKINISYCRKENEVIVPVLFVPFTLSLNMEDTTEKGTCLIRISILIDENFPGHGKKIKKEDVINIGKLFSDPSKLDILELISKRTCYGKELSNELNLSTATISYHVTALMKEGFIKAELVSNRVYYQPDKEKIERCLEDMKLYFRNL